MTSPQTTRRNPRTATLLASAALIFCAILPFIPSWSGPWLLDDLPLIVHNRNVTDPARWRNLWTGDYWASTGFPARMYRPLPMSTFALNWAVAPNPAAFRTVNALLHAAVALTLWLAILRRRCGWIGLLAAAAFAMHPVHCDAVDNVTGRAEILLALFLLLSVGVFPRLIAGAAVARWLFFLLAVLGMLLSKETGLFLAGVPLVWLAIRRRMIARRAPLRRRALAAIAVVTLCALAYLWARWLAVGALPGNGNVMPIADRIKLSGSALLRSLSLLFIPNEHRAVWRIPDLESMSWIYPIAGLVTFAILTGTTALLILRRNAMGFPLAVLLLAMIPLAHPRTNVIWIWERGLYVPCLAACWLAALWITRLSAASSRRRIYAAVCLCIILALEALVTARRSDLYGSELRFWKHQHQIDPSDTGTITSYSEVLLRVARTAEAVKLREAACQLEPQRGELLAPLAAAYLHAGRLQEAAERLTTESMNAIAFQSPQSKAMLLAQLADYSRKCGAMEAAERFLAMRGSSSPVNSTPAAK